MAAEAGTCCGAVGLDGITLVKQAFLIQLPEQPPHSFYVAVVIGYVWIVHVDPIAHAVCQSFPFAGKLHYFATAGGVVVVDTDFLSDIFFCYP